MIELAGPAVDLSENEWNDLVGLGRFTRLSKYGSIESTGAIGSGSQLAEVSRWLADSVATASGTSP